MKSYNKVEHVKTLWSKLSNKKKIECKNHILRNYINRINDMVGKIKCSSGIFVPGVLRKILKIIILDYGSILVYNLIYKKMNRYFLAHAIICKLLRRF